MHFKFKTRQKFASSPAACLIGVAALTASIVLAAASGVLGDTLPPGVAYASNADPVRITSISYSPSHVARGGAIVARVVCTSNAAAVTARVGSVVVNLPKQAPGIFRARLHVPLLPLYSSHQTVVITAIRTDGATARKTLSVDIR